MAKAKQLKLFALMPNPDFEVFWEKYPRKEAKIAAREAFEKVTHAKIVTVRKIISTVERFAQHVIGREIEKIPLPATWLNAGRWDDEYDSKGTDDYSWRAHKRAQTGVSKYQ